MFGIDAFRSLYFEMTKRSRRFDVRVPELLNREIRQQAKTRGYASPSAFVRAAVEKELAVRAAEPPQDAKDQAIARAKDRHNRLVKSAGTAMVGDSRSAMQDLVNRDEK
jgi:Arc/MetJ-type ribon-helix-helix transcriptional regulator